MGVASPALTVFVVALASFVLTAPALTWAQGDGGTGEGPAPGQVGDGAPADVGEMEVHGRVDPADATRVDAEDVAAQPHASLGEAILEIPGVAASRRAEGATEPVLRGLGGERVVTQAGPVPILGACPSAMDPPITYFAANGAESVEVVTGLPSVRLGPGGTGGRLVLEPGPSATIDGATGLGGYLSGAYDFARRGAIYSGVLGGRTPRFAASLGGQMLRLHDYRSGGDVVVPADHERHGASLALAAAPIPGHRAWATASWTHERGVDFPALPMDNEETDFWLVTTGYRIRRLGSLVRSISVEGGVAFVDHLMSNRWKSNRARLLAATDSQTLTYGARLELGLRPRRGMDLWAGLDLTGAHRDALRERHVVAMDRTFTDHLWPEASQVGVGLYAELRTLVAPRLTLLAGARGTLFSSQAAGSADAAMGGQTVAEAWGSFSEGSVGGESRVEGQGSARAILLFRAGGGVRLHVGTALSMRPAGLTERYFAYGPAPGGYQVGDPSLAPEVKWGTSLGAVLSLSWIEARATVFHAWLPTYILRTAVARQDVDDDGAEETIRGFVNTSAQLVGVELAAEPRVGDLLSFPVTLAWVRGWNRDDGRDLPEIPPFEATLAARIGWGDDVRLWLEVGGRLVAAQRQVDELFVEDETDGFALLRVRGGLAYRDRLRLEVAADNLLDVPYNEHLTREALLPAADLAPGDEVQGVGRRITLSALVTF